MKKTKISDKLPPHTYRKQNICDNTLDNAQLEAQCPLDNGRHDCTPISMRFDAGLLDRFPLELIIDVLLQLDIPSLTRLRSLNRRMMELVNSVRQYAAIIKHCPNIIRAIVSIQADSFDCTTLYGTLCTRKCSTCRRFGDHLYLVDCRRVCYLCFIKRPEYFPVTSYEASKLFASDATSQSNTKGPRKLLLSAPSILSLPGRYCHDANLRRKRLRLYDRQAVVQNLPDSGPPQLDRCTTEPKRFMAIITAPILLNAGRRVERGFFCLGCVEEVQDRTSHSKHLRNQYTRQGLSKHIAKCGPVVKAPDRLRGFMHAKCERKL